MKRQLPFSLYPNPGAGRAWSRDEWKRLHRLCRIATKQMAERFDEGAYLRMLKELAVFGCCTTTAESLFREPR